MRTILSFALLVSAAAQAQTLAPAGAVLVRSSLAVQAQGSEAPPSSSPSAPRHEMGSSVPEQAPTPEARPLSTGPAEPEAAAPAPAPAGDMPADAPTVTVEESELRTTTAEQQRLVHGAPLYNPNVAVHIVQKKRFADEGQHEFSLYPVAVQVNGKFTNHLGSALHYTYHLQENFALQVAGQYNWYTDESDFNLELIDKVREQAQAASSLLLQWGAQVGVEVTPLYGKFAFYDNTLAQFSVVLNGGAGLGGTRHLIRPEVSNQVGGETFTVPARFGSAGNKFLGSVGGGFRLQLGDSYAVRLEVKDLIYTARVDRVDGCNLADFEQMEAARVANAPFEGLPLSGGCKYQKFDGVDPKTRKNYREDIILGRDLVEEPSSDVLNNVSFYAGFSVLF